MPRTKQLDLKLHYGGTDLYVNDLGRDKSPRFELYDVKEKKVISKSNNPTDFDAWLLKHDWKGKIHEMETS